MKELSIEEKAKAYDEAIERARIYSTTTNSVADAELIELIFPELKESEDKKIRESLLEYLHTLPNHYAHSGVCALEWIAWLEKQGEKPNNVYDKELSEILGQVIRRYINDPNIPYTEREKVSMEIIPYVERLEKQGEKKLTPIFRIGDTIIAKDGTYIEKEPFHIDRIEDDCYWDGENTILVCNQEEFEIFEQKPADKIQLGKKYKCIGSPRYSMFVKGLIYRPEDKFLCSLMNLCSDCFEPIEDNIKPTAKEQRDTLERTMTNASYRWNKEELKLEKI